MNTGARWCWRGPALRFWAPFGPVAFWVALIFLLVPKLAGAQVSQPVTIKR